MFYLVYKITNMVNGKYYIGCHVTDRIDDGYFGSGKILHLAIEKYGVDNFKKEILYEAINKQEMFDKEKDLVTICPESYNLKCGGCGGWDYANKTYSKEKRLMVCKLGGYSTKGILKGRKIPEEIVRKRSLALKGRVPSRGMTDIKHKQKSKDIMSVKKLGSLNPNHSKIWIMNLSSKESKMVSKTSVIPDGWEKGRLIRLV